MQSIQAQESPSEEYLSDYAYIDTVRLSHYYGQLSEHGLVTQSKHTSKTTGKDTGKLEVKAMVLAGAGQIEVGSERSVELQVDPYYSRPQQTLDALYEAGYIGSGLTNARIGDLVLAKGKVSIFDIRLLKEIWQYLGDIITADEGAHIQNAKERQKFQAAKKKEFENMAQIVSKLPHSVQGTFMAGTEDAWFTLQPEHMRINPEDIVFKYGCDLDGDWHMLGIVDALPDHMTAPSDAASRVSTELEVGLRFMVQQLRGALGRPQQRYGITPIMIFRTIKRTENGYAAEES